MIELNIYNKKSTTLIIHILLWIIIFAISASQIYLRIGLIPIDFCLKFSILFIAFYLNYYIFVPKILLNKKYFIYIVVVLILSMCFVYLIEFVIPKPQDIKIPKGFPNDLRKPPLENKFLFFRSLPVLVLILLFLTLSTSIKLSVEWFKSEKIKSITESQKVNSELSFLKAQLNPHFLFNTLNSIYALANKKSEDTTIAIVTLSELMRYMIYEANENTVALEKEINYIKNYISLQLLRLKDSSGVRVNIHGDLNYQIEPLLLISFIENAFKYGTDFKGNTNIRIRITVKNNELNLLVYNTSSYQREKNENSGIGLENIKNRLNLLYPSSHTLKIINDKKYYEVNLNLILKNIKT